MACFMGNARGGFKSGNAFGEFSLPFEMRQTYFLGGWPQRSERPEFNAHILNMDDSKDDILINFDNTKVEPHIGF